MSFKKLQTEKSSLPCLYFIGIGGAGMSALAGLFKQLGLCVTGSDMVSKETTAMLQKLGIPVLIPQKAKNIQNLQNKIDIIVASNGIPNDNPELQLARQLNIPIINYPQALGILTNTFKSIGIAGTHGKSSTTAIVAKILDTAPQYANYWALIGALNPNFNNTNFRYTPIASTTKQKVLQIIQVILKKVKKLNNSDVLASAPQTINIANHPSGKYSLQNLLTHELFNDPTIQQLKNNITLPYFIFEADEYKDAFLQHTFEYLLITNTEFDHPDYFKTHENYLKSFANAILNTKKAVILNKKQDSYKQLIKIVKKSALAQTTALKNQTKKPTTTTKLPKFIDYSSYLKQAQELPLYLKTQFLIEDTAAALALANTLGITPENQKIAMKNYKGIWRRFQVLHEKPYLINDYAHNPKKILYASLALRDFMKQHKLQNAVVFWEPHQYHRTYTLQKEYAKVLQSILSIKGITHFYITDIFAARSTKQEMQKFNAKKFIAFLKKEILSTGTPHATKNLQSRNKLSQLQPLTNKLFYANKPIQKIKQEIKEFVYKNPTDNLKSSNNTSTKQVNNVSNTAENLQHIKLIPRNTQVILIMSAGKLGIGW